jgi:hypothetical protein
MSGLKEIINEIIKDDISRFILLCKLFTYLCIQQKLLGAMYTITNA